MYWRKTLALLAVGLCAGAIALVAANRLPSLDGRNASSAITDTAGTRLGKAVAPLAAAHPGASGVHALLDSRDAFAARVLLAQAAERSLDVQYYIWHGDMSGRLLLEALHAAAERGVRVRLLLDDNNTAGLDAALSGLDAHPNIEVRLFNPFPIRSPRAIGYLLDFPRLNRRMHNKSFTADGRATIIGGRNVGDEYFDATGGVAFVDLDVLAVGPVVDDVSKDFDRYWSSESAYPADRLLPAAKPAPAKPDPAAAAYMAAVRDSPFVRDLIAHRLPLEWTRVRMVSDDPAKVLGKAPAGAFMPQQLKDIFGDPTDSLDLVSPYFVPGEVGMPFFTGMAARGVKVRILTNALEATDVAAVHAGYSRRRPGLLDAGITLYEMRLLAPRTEPDKAPGPGSSGRSSLHAKTFAVDRSRVFIGSFNFDPRSARLNTEIGFVIDSPALAKRIAAAFDAAIPERAYEVRSEAGKLHWIERRDGNAVRHDNEPGTSVWLRAGVWALSLLPIEGLL